MSSTELKLKIIRKVTTISDDGILEEIYKLINLESEIDSIYQLTDEEKSAVDIGLNDISEGCVHSSEVAERMMKEWLKK